MPPPECPPGQCRQCWHHAYVLHKGNWLGLLKEDDCQPCLDHMRNGHGNQVVPKKKRSWW